MSAYLEVAVACFVDFFFQTAFVVWANSELKHFVTRFSCQVFRGEMSLAAVGVCVSMAKQQCEKVTYSKQ